MDAFGRGSEVALSTHSHNEPCEDVLLSNIAQSKVQHSPPHVPNRKQIFPSMSYNEQWLTPVRGMLTPSQPANRLPSAASGTAYPAIWTGASHVQCLCSSGTDTDPDPPATLPGVPTPHDAGPHRIKLQRSGSAHFRMLRLRPRLRTTCRRSCDLGQIGQDLEAVPARGCEPGPPSTDIMTKQHIRSPSSSDPRDVVPSRALREAVRARLGIVHFRALRCRQRNFCRSSE